MKFTIIGGGPAGFACAALLAKQGHECAVYESRLEIPNNPEDSYPIGINSRTLHCLESIDVSVAEQARDTGRIVDAWQIYAGSRMVSNLKSGVVYGTSRAKVNYIVYDASIKNPNVKVFFGYKLIGLDFATKQAIFETRDKTVVRVPPSATTSEIEITRIIAADGVRSIVRDSLVKNVPDFKVKLTPWTFEFRALFAEPGVGLDLSNLDTKIHYICNGMYSATVDNGGQQQWSCVVSTRDSDPPEVRDLVLSKTASPENIAALRAMLVKNSPLTQELFSDDELTRFFDRRTFRGAIVECARLNYEEWVLLIGDAAHSVLPPVGEGINSAMEDADVLAQCALQHGFSENLFTEYNKLRHPDVLALAKYALYLNEQSKIPGEGGARLMARILQSLAYKETIDNNLFGPLGANRKRYSKIFVLSVLSPDIQTLLWGYDK
ncbi:hypothetical protein HK100_010350 [Physocladia obscura]|uniref:FAD-binding domain-containing protein n=1 Tax=Physocladia obscura TaxID=109957 RepID=A0AAD5XER1_9FUNG|nr:hypothetical protein HK100_010350 [Physocladia obscura]